MQWHQLDHMQTMCTSLQTDNHTNTSSLSFCRPDALPDTQPTVSMHWRPNFVFCFPYPCKLLVSVVVSRLNWQPVAVWCSLWGRDQMNTHCSLAIRSGSHDAVLAKPPHSRTIRTSSGLELSLPWADCTLFTYLLNLLIGRWLSFFCSALYDTIRYKLLF